MFSYCSTPYVKRFGNEKDQQYPKAIEVQMSADQGTPKSSPRYLYLCGTTFLRFCFTSCFFFVPLRCHPSAVKWAGSCWILVDLCFLFSGSSLPSQHAPHTCLQSVSKAKKESQLQFLIFVLIEKMRSIYIIFQSSAFTCQVKQKIVSEWDHFLFIYDGNLFEKHANCSSPKYSLNTSLS